MVSVNFTCPWLVTHKWIRLQQFETRGGNLLRAQLGSNLTIKLCYGTDEVGYTYILSIALYFTRVQLHRTHRESNILHKWMVTRARTPGPGRKCPQTLEHSLWCIERALSEDTIALKIQVTERENDQNIKSLKIQKKIQYSERLHVGTYYLP